jgi:hypothetical protein
MITSAPPQVHTMYYEAANKAIAEIQRAQQKHGSFPFYSTHQGYGVLLEEVDEMWDEIRRDNLELSIKEAIQVAAMALRYVAEFGAVVQASKEV